MTWIKAHRKIIALAVAGIALLLAIRAWERSHDAAIAQMMADKIMAKHRAASKAIIAKWAKLNAAKDQELATWKQGNQVLSAEIQAKRRELSIKAKTLAEAQAALDKCTAYLGEVDASYTLKLSECENLWRSKVALKDAEILEWRAKDEASIVTIGDLTKRLVMAQLDKGKRLVFGPQAGYNPITKQGYVGFGGTYDVGLRFKVGGLL